MPGNYRIHIQTGTKNLNELIDDLAKQVVHKSMHEIHTHKDRIKKITFLGHAV